MPREPLDAPESLRGETPCQVAFGQLQDECAVSVTDNVLVVRASAAVRAIAVSDDTFAFAGERAPSPRVRGMFAWEHWLRREQ